MLGMSTPIHSFLYSSHIYVLLSAESKQLKNNLDGFFHCIHNRKDYLPVQALKPIWKKCQQLASSIERNELCTENLLAIKTLAPRKQHNINAITKTTSKQQQQQDA